jgi:hypothetical protein
MMRLEVPVVANIKLIVSWMVTQCNVVGRYQRFEETCCLHLQGRRISRAGRYYMDIGKGGSRL